MSWTDPLSPVQPTLDEIAAITASRRAEGYPPPLGGGGGIWEGRIPFAEKRLELVKKESVIEGVLGPLNLMKETSPTIMEIWALTDIRVPIVVTTGSGPFEAAVISQISIQVILRYGGDIIWSDEEKLLNTKLPGIFQFIMAQNFSSPPVIKRGRILTIELVCKTELEKELKEELLTTRVLISSVLQKNNPIPSEGTFTYQSTNLSGHRTL